MVSMNLWKKCICHQITKPKSAHNFIPQHSAHMVTDVNSFTPNLIYSINSSTQVWFWRKMLDYQTRDQTSLRKLTNYNHILTYFQLGDLKSLSKLLTLLIILTVITLHIFQDITTITIITLITIITITTIIIIEDINNNEY